MNVRPSYGPAAALAVLSIAGFALPADARAAGGEAADSAQTPVPQDDVVETVAPVGTEVEGAVPSRTAFRATLTNFLGALVAGDGNGDARFGGKLDGYATIDGRDLGLWDGFTVNAHAEFVYGNNINTVDAGLLVPTNTALAFPSNDGADFDLALNFTQRIGTASLTLGKINMITSASRTPIVNSDGREGFQNLGVSAPLTLTTPPSIFGAIMTIPLGRPTLTLGIWDPHSAVNEAWPDDLFGDGVNGMVSLMLPVTIGGRRGFQSLMFSGTTKLGLDLRDIPDLILPPESETILGERRGGWLVRYQFQQFLWQDPQNPGRGWGAFGKLTVWDDNPLPAAWSMSLGLSGNLPIASRPNDRFGIGYFRTSLSDTLRDGLRPIIALGDEHGVELFYTLEIMRNVRLSADLQIIEPMVSDRDTAVFAGLRLLLGT